MKYTSFQFQNYKGIQNLTIKINQNDTPISIVGADDSGKTTILEAIHITGLHIKQLSKYHTFPYFNNKAIQNIIPNTLSDFNKPIVFSANISDRNIKYVITVTYYLHDSKYERHEITITKNGKDIAVADKEEEINYISKHIPNIFFYPNFYRKSSEENDNILFILSSSEKEIRENGPNGSVSQSDIEYYQKHIQNNRTNIEWQNILHSLRINAEPEHKDRKAHENAFQKEVVDYVTDKNESGNEACKRKLRAISNKLTKEIIDKWKQCSISEKDNNIDKITLEDITRNFDSPFREYAIRIVEKDTREYKLKDRSLGFNWFVAFVLYTTFKLKENENAIFLLDETASNLFAPIQRDMLKQLQRLARKKAVIIYTTHSPFFLSQKEYKNMYATTNEKKNNISSIEIHNCFNNAKVLQNKNITDALYPYVSHLLLTLPSILVGVPTEHRPRESDDADTLIRKREKAIEHICNKLHIPSADLIAQVELLSSILTDNTVDGVAFNIHELYYLVQQEPKTDTK